MTREEAEKELAVEINDMLKAPMDGWFDKCVTERIARRKAEEKVKEGNEHLLRIYKQAGESCPGAPSPIDAFKILGARVKELEEKITNPEWLLAESICLAKERVIRSLKSKEG